MTKNNNAQQHEFEPYQPDNVPLLEALYGKNLISLDGLAAIDNMFSKLINQMNRSQKFAIRIIAKKSHSS